MSTLMMPTTMTTMTNPGPIPAHSVPQKMEPPKLTAAATLTHTPTPANKSGATYKFILHYRHACAVLKNLYSAPLFIKRCIRLIQGNVVFTLCN